MHLCSSRVWGFVLRHRTERLRSVNVSGLDERMSHPPERSPVPQCGLCRLPFVLVTRSTVASRTCRRDLRSFALASDTRSNYSDGDVDDAQIQRYTTDVQRAQELASHHMADRKDVR